MLHKAIRIACGAFCCTAASVLQVETGESALALRRSQQEIKYSVKVKTTEGHPAKSATEIHWTVVTKKFKPIFQYTVQVAQLWQRDRANSAISRKRG